jgi:hypothetical protein
VSGERLRAARAVEVLEPVGTEAARALLAAWRAQAHDPWLAAEAALALARRP